MQGAISSTSQYDHVFVNHGAKCTVVVISALLVIEFGVQVGFLLSGNDKLVKASIFLSLGVVALASFLFH